VLVTVSKELQINAQSRYEGLLFPAGEPNVPEFMCDRHGRWSREETIALDRLAMVDAARDFYIMSLTDIQILSPDSGFGVVGSMVGLRTKHVMYQMGSGLRNCSAAPEGDSLSLFAHKWSGL
jgi:hypothetical protein